MPKALAHTIGVKEFSWGSLGAPVGPGQGLDRGSGDKGSRSSTYLTFANILRRCKINQFLFTNVRYTKHDYMESPLSILEIVNFFNFIGFGPERDDCFSSQFEQRNIYFNTFCSTAQKSKT